MPIAKQSILQAYRHLYRTSLRAVNYSRPARYEIRDILRETFRTSPPQNFNARRIQNTIKFLENAQKYNGFEHRILKNLTHLQFWKGRGLDKRLKQSIRDSNTPAAMESRKQICDMSAYIAWHIGQEDGASATHRVVPFTRKGRLFEELTGRSIDRYWWEIALMIPPAEEMALVTLPLDNSKARDTRD